MFASGSYPIEFLFYFKEGVDTENVRRALAMAAPLFWPVFGRYQDGRIHSDIFREDDHFSEEKLSLAFDPAAAVENPLETRRRYALPDTGRLFSLKIIQFANGSALIPKMSHLAGDGYSYFFLLSALAAFARGRFPQVPALMYRTVFRPVHSRTVVRKFEWEGWEGTPPSPVQDLNMLVERIPKAGLKRTLNEIFSSAQMRVSSNDLLSAMAFRKVVELGREAFGERVRLTFPMDVRRAVRKLGPRFFGNGILFHDMEWPKEDILRWAPEELAVEIRKTLPRLNEDAFRLFLEKMEGFIYERNEAALRPFDPEAGCLVTNISRLPADRLHFGRGIPSLIAPLTVGKNSAGVLSDGEDYVLQIVT